jgi:hypothetical protein
MRRFCQTGRIAKCGDRHCLLAERTRWQRKFFIAAPSAARQRCQTKTMPRFVVTIHGHKFCIPMKGGGPSLARGFLVFRRVTAPDATSAKKKASEMLLRETPVRNFIRLTEESEKDARWFVRAERVTQLSWLNRWFWRSPPQGFIFYEHEDEEV